MTPQTREPAEPTENDETSPTTDRTVIVGAGPAGLTAALELGKLGRRGVVLESDDIVGGISRSVVFEGCRMDIGGHRFFTKVPEVEALWHEILGDDLLVRERMSRIFYRDRFFDYPLQVRSTRCADLGHRSRRCGSIGELPARPALSRSPTRAPSTPGSATASAGGCSRSSSRPTPRRCGACRARRSAPTWAAQRIKNLDLKTALKSAFLGRGTRERRRRGHQPDRPLLLPAARSRA